MYNTPSIDIDLTIISNRGVLTDFLIVIPGGECIRAEQFPHNLPVLCDLE